jgi:glycerophosphoryl diester phosphodiesterase
VLSSPHPPRPLVFGHRGASAFAPGNTLAAFTLAVEHGADGVELDVRASADGALMVHHDPAIPDLGPIAGLTFAAIRSGAPHVPTLDEVVPVLGELLVDIEIKNDPSEPGFDPSHRTADAVAAWVERHGLADRVMVSSFHPGTVARMHRVAPAVPTGQLFAPGWVPERDMVLVAAAGHRWVLPHYGDVVDDAAAVVAVADRHGLGVIVWTVDDPEAITRLVAGGVAGIVSNDPGRARRVVDGITGA